MGFNTSAFMLAGTAIAILGVGLYIYDTRKGKLSNYYTGTNNQNNRYNRYSAQYDQYIRGGTKKNRKTGLKKTKRHL